MARFLLILAPERPALDELSAGDIGRSLDAFAGWLRTLRESGALCGGMRAVPPGARLSRSDRAPFAWTGACEISGCLLVEAASLEAAAELARGCPGVSPGCIEILEIDAGSELGIFRESA